MKRIHVFISGNVQGVGFRFSCKQEADRLGIVGWIKNLPTGQVEAIFEGNEEPLNRILAWCMVGPEGAQVEHIEKHEEKVERLRSFEILT